MRFPADDSNSIDRLLAKRGRKLWVYALLLFGGAFFYLFNTGYTLSAREDVSTIVVPSVSVVSSDDNINGLVNDVSNDFHNNFSSDVQDDISSDTQDDVSSDALDGFTYDTSNDISNDGSISSSGGGSHRKDGPPEDEYLAMCLAVKNQGLDLAEWLHHHYYNIGVGKFYIMDDASDPPLSNFTDTIDIPFSAVDFHRYEKKEHVRDMQYFMYAKCIEFAKGKHMWMAFLDMDEFLDAPGPETVREVLESFEPIEMIGAVGASWQMHTSNGQLVRQPSVLKGFTECIADEDADGGPTDNRHIKSIVRAKNYGRPLTPHYFSTTNRTVTVGEHGDWLTDSFRNRMTRDRIAVHHYAIKSREEMEAKMNRGSAMGHLKTWDFWDHVEGLPHVECNEMLKWLEE